jgi:predicted DNA-binding transcriptional regulator YafY
MNRIDRLFALLLLLQVKRRLTAREIAVHFGITERTVYRDMKALSEMGIPVAAQAGEGYQLLDTFSLPPVAFTEGEAKAITMAARWFVRNSTGTLRRDTLSSLHKLHAILTPALRDQVEQFTQLIDHYPTDPALDWEQPALLLVLRAVQERRVLRIEYRGYQSDITSNREIEPTRLTFSQGAWYVEAYCRLRRDQRSFRLNRMMTLELRDETFTPRMMIAAPIQGMEVCVRFAAHALPHVRERQHYAFVREEGDAMVYSVEALTEIRNWILGFGADAEVMAPDTLRVWLRTEAQRLISLLT